MGEDLLKKGLTLEYMTMGWNVFECAIVLFSALQSGSIALLGFGLDSLIEIFASVVVVWQLKNIHKNSEKKAHKLIGYAFILISLYILAESAYSLTSGRHAGASFLGIFSLLLTFIAMYTLSLSKEKIGRSIKNSVLVKEARVTKIDAYLSASVLVGLILNALFSFWWADPLAGLVIVFYGLKEGADSL